MERARKAKEGHKSFQQRALKLFKNEYAKRLPTRDFILAITLFKEEGNAVTFVTLQDPKYKEI